MSVWEQISDALRAGEDPVVYISYSMLSTIVRPEPPRRKGPLPKQRVAFSLYGKTPHAGRKTDVHRCWNPYCRKRLTGRFVCNEQCKVAAREHLEHALSLLGGVEPVGPVEDVPDVPVFDEEGRDRNAAARADEGKVIERRGRRPKGYRARESTPSDPGRRLFERVLREEARRRKEPG